MLPDSVPAAASAPTERALPRRERPHASVGVNDDERHRPDRLVEVYDQLETTRIDPAFAQGCRELALGDALHRGRVGDASALLKSERGLDALMNAKPRRHSGRWYRGAGGTG